MNNIIMADAGGDALWEHIDDISVSNLSDYTSTKSETIDTNYSIVSLDYVFFLAIITSDKAISTDTEWGRTVQVIGRSVPSGSTSTGQATMQRGAETLNFSQLEKSTVNTNSCGVWITNNKYTIQITRQCHPTAMPLVRGGNYTIKLYGLKSFG